MFFHEFGHIDPDHRIVIVKQILSHSLGQFGLTHTRWPKEQERSKRAVFIIQTRPRTADRIGHSRYSSTLADHTTTKLFFHTQQLFALTFKHLGHRDAGPTLNDLSDLFRAHRIFDHQVIGLLSFTKLAFKIRNDAIRHLSSLGQITLTFGDIQFGAGTIKLFFQATRPF